MALRALAPDDVVATHADAARNARPPLFVLDPLVAFLDRHGIGSGEVTLRPIGEGVSNVTCLLTRGATQVVIRRPPRPPLPPSAHDVLREATILGALARRTRVPAVRAVCSDPAVIGAPFFVMDEVPGDVLTDRVPAALDTPRERRNIAIDLIDTLVELHAVDHLAAGLEGFGRATGYPQRQVRRFSGLWEHTRTRELPAVDRVARWLGEHLPPPAPATIVHGDFRLGNTIVARATPGRIAAVLDWELSTIGDPLADLAYLLVTWTDRDDPPAGPIELSPVTRTAGFPTRGELRELYATRSGRDVSSLRWFEVLSAWKFAVFMEGNYKRALAGTTDDPHLAGFGDKVVEIAERAEAMTHRR